MRRQPMSRKKSRRTWNRAAGRQHRDNKRHSKRGGYRK